jgi:hypothetical protein
MGYPDFIFNKAADEGIKDCFQYVQLKPVFFGSIVREIKRKKNPYINGGSMTQRINF